MCVRWFLPGVYPAILLLALLGACSALPRSGPSHQAIRSQAAARIIPADKAEPTEYALVELTGRTLAYFDEAPPASLEKGFGLRRDRAPELVLGVGDVLQVSIFESQSGGLFIPEDAGSRPGNYITLPNQTVDGRGMITVPYAGSLRVAGRRAADVQAEIEHRLVKRAIEPQVVITTVTSRSNRVSVLGDVAAPAQLDVNPAGEKMLDVIARAGGISSPGDETSVTVERQTRKATVLFQTLLARPTENIYVLPGDTVYVERERRTYLAFGATGLNGRIDFDDSDLTLGEAIGKAGGLIDSRADPAEVFLYRVVPRDTLARLGVDLSQLPGTAIPTVFHADLRKPATLFATQRFRMSDKDILYVSNSDAVEVTKFLDLISGTSYRTAEVPKNVVATRNAVRRLSD